MSTSLVGTAGSAPTLSVSKADVLLLDEVPLPPRSLRLAKISISHIVFRRGFVLTEGR